MDTTTIAKTQKVIKEWPYTWTALDKGYADKILYVNVGSGEIKETGGARLPVIARA